MKGFVCARNLLIKPYNFDKKTKYPALIYVYNGPGVQLLNNRWLASAPLWMYYLANQGYIIFTVDGRGSENRGRDFEQVIFKQLGAIEMIDQIKADFEKTGSIKMIVPWMLIKIVECPNQINLILLVEAKN